MSFLKSTGLFVLLVYLLTPACGEKYLPKRVHDVDLLPSGNYMVTDGGDAPDGTSSAVYEITSNGEIVWSYRGDLLWAHNADRLSNGNVLISDTHNNRAIIVDPTGTIQWSSDNVIPLTDGSEFNYLNDVNQLDNGNLLISGRDNHRIVEITRLGEVVWQFGETGVGGSNGSHLKGPHNPDRLSTGNTIICDSLNHRIIEVNPAKQIVWQYQSDLDWPRDADRLSSGDTLITDSRNDRVIQVDQDGNVVWEVDGLNLPYDADRLNNGNTLISNTDEILEVDPTGETVWSYPAPTSERTIYTSVPFNDGQSATGVVAVRLKMPELSRYPFGLPAVIQVPAFLTQSGHFAETLAANQIGALSISFLWSGQTDLASGYFSSGVYDHAGPQGMRAFETVAQFATGMINDVSGQSISDLAGMPVLTNHVGLYGFSHPGIAATNLMAASGASLPGVEYFVGGENPTNDQLTAVEIGYWGQNNTPMVNPYYNFPDDYDADNITLEYERVGWIQNALFPDGRPYFAVPGGSDFILDNKVPTMWGKRYYSVALTKALQRKGIFTPATWPADLATVTETEKNWPPRETPGHYELFQQSGCDFKVLLHFQEQDHVQSALDKPHIHQAWDGFYNTASLWTRLNPDQAYVAQVDVRCASAFPDNPANVEPADWSDMRVYAYRQPGLPVNPNLIAGLAGLAEMMDRAVFENWSANLDQVIWNYPYQPLGGYDQSPPNGDGLIDARDLVFFLDEVQSASQSAENLIDFSSYWQRQSGTTP